ncbi:extracellular solute-binding protein [Micromonospora sp. ATCC 39149]|uniref:extracellular solute-binding protein n=1 Tax=Micromonospora sp. (strain ATCC 39149 / NRRL 15099 / SCC 1413) TaxID=219305 RepID=UPI0018DE796B
MLTAINAKSNLQPLTDAPWLPGTAPQLRDITGLLNGTRYAALVTSPAVEGVYYNKEVFAAHGVTAPPKNFDEMVAVARQLKTRGSPPSTRWAPIGGPPSGGCRSSSPTRPRAGSGSGSTPDRRSSPTRPCSARSRSTGR